MAIYKCKMCSGELEVTEGVSVIECEYCGTKQTVPTAKDENLQGLFNRANTLRMKSEFDKAEQLYEKIIQKDDTQAEAYWGLILCKYGIEYVEDPETFKRIPTCHRASFDSIIADDDYKSAISHADSIQRGVYEEQAKEIDRIQKEILELSKKEEPYDVFICYKETDEAGKRTQDSVIANDIYYQLTKEGFKVFYAAITLENKLGSAYEPCIFAALNSAKVMLAIGTKPEHFNAVWVKNEWSRYLKILKKDRDKMLIPCYRDMDAYELPEEFAHLQAQDMSKIGFINDIVRGIQKVIVKDEPKETVKETVVVNESSANVESLLKRAFMFLEDGDFKSANEYAERVLDIDPENADAYLAKLLANKQCKKKEDLKNVAMPFENDNNYQKVMRFGSEKIKAELKGYIDFIIERNEQNRLAKIYNEALGLMKSSKVDDCLRAKNLFNSIIDYKDSKELLEKTQKRIEELSIIEKEKAEKELQRAKEEAQRKKEKAEAERKNNEYNKAIKMMAGENSNTYAQAMNIFHSLGEWKDSKEKAIECDKIIRELVAKEKELQAEKERQEELNRIKADESAKRTKLILKIATPIIAAVVVFAVVLNTVIIPNNKYEEALALMNDEKYEEAIAKFKKLNGHKDSEDKVVECTNIVNENTYNDAIEKYNNGNLSESLPVFFKMIDYKDSETIIKEAAKKLKNRIATGNYHTVGLKSDGTVVAVGENNYGECDVENWTDIIAISAGGFHTVGLKSNGTVVATGNNHDGRCDVSNWTDIVAISSGDSYTLGLKSNGTVVAVGSEIGGGTKASEWTNITSIAAGYFDAYGIRTDGTVVTTDEFKTEKIKDWKNICDISAHWHAIALSTDGNVLATENGKYGEGSISEWDDIIAIYAGDYHSVGINSIGSPGFVGLDGGKRNFDGWTEIIAISSYGDHTIGLKADGTLIATGESGHHRCDVAGWKLF